MSRLNIKKKLLPAKRAWRSFASTLHKKLRKLKKSNPINKTAKTLNTTLGTVFRLRRKRLIAPSSALLIHRRKHHLRPGFAPVYVDDLFMVQMSNDLENYKAKESATMAAGSSNVGKVDITVVNHPNLNGSSKVNEMNAEKVFTRGASSSTPQQLLRGVDERAEEFIIKFKEEMRLQRQRSFGEFQEMLARSA